MTFAFPEGFLWGASTAAHQIEGNNTASDLWSIENRQPSPMREPSGDACDSFHRWGEDLDIVADMGVNAYRFSIEWARIEPADGRVSNAMLAHYRQIVEGCLERSLTPVVTLHHFTLPRWFRRAGGWVAEDAAARFSGYVASVLPILDGVEWVCTINEPNMVALVEALRGSGGTATSFETVRPHEGVTEGLKAAHVAAMTELRGRGDVKAGWTVASQCAEPAPGGEEAMAEWVQLREDQWLELSATDDFVGVQSYSRLVIGPDGPVPPAPETPTTQMGWELYPAALGQAVRHTATVTGEVPILVTENGIATADDTERVAYTDQALAGLASAMSDGIDVRGYLHWSLLDNYEWGSFAPTFGLVAVDHTTFERRVKPSARHLGEIARAGGLVGD